MREACLWRVLRVRAGGEAWWAGGVGGCAAGAGAGAFFHSGAVGADSIAVHGYGEAEDRGGAEPWGLGGGGAVRCDASFGPGLPVIEWCEG